MKDVLTYDDSKHRSTNFNDYIWLYIYTYFFLKQIFRCSRHREMQSNYIFLCRNFVATRSMRETDVPGTGSISFLSDEEPCLREEHHYFTLDGFVSKTTGWNAPEESRRKQKNRALYPTRNFRNENCIAPRMHHGS